MTDTDFNTQERQANLRKIDTEIAKMLAETKQIGVSTFLAPFLAAAGLMGATAAVVKLFF
jgi:adenylylsulfate kinase-like enzyme